MNFSIVRISFESETSILKNRKILEHDVFCKYLPTIDEYKSQLTQANFHIVKVVHLTGDWKSFTEKRLDNFRQKKEHF